MPRACKVRPQQEGLLIGFLTRICNESYLKGTLCSAVHKCYNGVNFNKCLAKVSLITANDSFGFYL